MTFSPVGFFDLQPGLNVLESNFYPDAEISQHPGLYSLEYEIKGTVSGITKDIAVIRVVDLKDAIDLSASPVNVGDNNANIEITNTQNTNLTNITLDFISPFFNQNVSFSLQPYQSTNISLQIDKSNIKNLTSGEIPFTAGITLGNANAASQGTIDYLPGEATQLTKSLHGFIVISTQYTKTNIGNVPVAAQINVTKDVLSRLFTINSVSPNQTIRSTLYDTYTWSENLQPGQSYSITSTTNYTLPFIFLLVIIIVALSVKLYTRTNLIVDKKISYVKTKGGEFALKVSLHIKAKKYIENIQIIDRLPGVAQLYEKFGVMPDKVDTATKRLFWNIDRLNKGEERVYSYIIYSRIRVVGRFELPSAAALYMRNGKTEEVLSNKAFFVTETTSTDLI